MSDDKWKRYLAWDTSSATGLVCAFEVRGHELREVASWSLSLETSRHSERLLWSIDTVLQSAGWAIQEISGIAVGIGPGSFTGLRIGVTTARMLATALKIPVTPLSSLAVLARNALEILPSLEKTLVIACTDATKGEWFTLMGSAKGLRDCLTFAEGDLPGVWGRGVSESTLPPEILFPKIQEALKKLGPEGKWLAVGQSVARYPEEWKSLPQKSRIREDSPSFHQSKAQALTQLAFEAIQQAVFRAPESLKPRYLRDSEAEVKLKAGLLKPSPIHHRGGVA